LLFIGIEENRTSTQLCDLALRVYGLRDEIYIQLMKQITKNPSNESKFRGWKLLEICLKSFPPSDDLENFLDYFCRKNSRIRLTKLIYSRIYVGAEESTASAKTDVEGAEEVNGVRNVRTNETIHGAVTRRLSTAGLLWKDKKKIKKKKKNAYQTTKSNKWNNNYSTLNTEKEVTEDVLLCKKRNDRVRDQPKKRLGRHTQAIMKRLGQEAKKTDVLTINLNIRKKEKEQNNKSARRRKEDLRRVLGGQSPVRRSKKYLPLNSRNADRNRNETDGRWGWQRGTQQQQYNDQLFHNSHANDEEGRKMHEQWLHSIEKDTNPYDNTPGYIGIHSFHDDEVEENDLHALHEQWQEETYCNDIDGPAFIKAHVRGDGVYGEKRSNFQLQPTRRAIRADRIPPQSRPGKLGKHHGAEDFSGLTARKIIMKTQPQRKHIRTYTMPDMQQYL